MVGACRHIGRPEVTLCSWKKKYAGISVGELRKLKRRAGKNSRLQRIVADLTLDKQILLEIVRKEP